MTARRLSPLLFPLLLLGGCGDDAAGTFQGYLEGEYLRIAAPDAGWLESVSVAEGQSIAAGAPLFALERAREAAAVAEARARLAQAESELADRLTGSRPEEIAALEAQLEEAEAARRLARQDLERQRQLAAASAAAKARLDQARSAASQAEARVERMKAELATARLPARSERVRAAEAAVEAARAALAQAEWRLAQRTVASPAAALVEDLVRDPGEWVPAGGAIVSLLPPGSIKVVFFVPEPQRAAVRPGGALKLSCDGCPAGLTARVTRLATEAEFTPPVIYSRETRAKLVFRAEAALPEGAAGLMPGQPVTLEPAP